MVTVPVILPRLCCGSKRTLIVQLAPGARVERHLFTSGKLAVEAIKARKISELPVVDRGGHLVGLIDLTDLIGLVPSDLEE